MDRTARWNWLDDGLLPLVVAGMRACWLWPWMASSARLLTMNQPGAVLPGWLVLLLPPLGLTLARRVAGAQSSDAAGGNANARIPLGARLTVAVTGLLVTLLVLWWQLYRGQFSLVDPAWLATLGDSLIHWPTEHVPAAVIVALFTLGLWMMGLLDAPQGLGHDNVWRALGVGICAVVLYVLAQKLVGNELPAQISTNTLWLLGLGMTGLAFTSLKVTEGLDRALGSGQRSGAAMPTINRYWFTSATVTIGGVLLVGVLLGTLIAPEVLAAVLGALRAVVTFIGQIITYIFLGISYVFLFIMYFVFRLLEPLFQREGEEEPLETELFQMPDEQQDPLQELQNVAQAPMPDSYRWIIVAVMVVLVALAFALVLRRLSAAKREENDETRESVLSAELLQEQFGTLWQNMLKRLRPGERLNLFLALDGEADTRRQIRAAYQGLLRSAQRVGQGRTPSVTPGEYAQQLGADYRLRHDAAVQDALHTLTEGYLAARYAADTPDAETAQRAQQAWERINSRLHPPDDPSEPQTKDQ